MMPPKQQFWMENGINTSSFSHQQASTIFIPQNGTCSGRNSIIHGMSFGGVPVVLAFNFGGFLLLLLLFCIIRAKCYNHGRIALVADNALVMEEGHGNGNASPPSTAAEKGFLSWMLFTYNLSDEQIQIKSGLDGVNYLSFKRHLIFLLLIMTVISLSVILPINLIGNLQGEVHFEDLTIRNVPHGNSLLWVHTGVAVIFLILTIILLRHHTSQVEDRSRENTTNTLFLCSVPKTATVEDINAHFIEAYPTCEVTAVTLGYDVNKLMSIDQDRIKAGEILHYYESLPEKTEKSKKINPHVCGQLRSCCSSQEVDAIEFYRNKEQHLLDKMREELEKELPRPLGMAFVTFKTNAMAKLVLKDFNAVKCKTFFCGRRPKSTSKSEGLKVKNWRVKFATFARSINWKNLSVQGFKWFGQFLLVNLVLLALVTFLTTPSMMVNTLSIVTVPLTNLMVPIVSQLFPTLLLAVFSSLLPSIVYHSTSFESHWSSSGEQLSTMRKLYFFLLFMVIILPSLGLTSIAGLFEWLIERFFHGKGTLRFACLVKPNQGVFMVNYVITAAFSGSVLELLRFPDLLVYIIRLIFARSAAERKYVKQDQAYASQYGSMYGWTLCVFTIITTYSIICPIITPFGLVFMLIRHFVDKHNLYSAYLPNPLNSHVHIEAINMVMAAPIFCLLWLYFYFVVTSGFWSAITIFTMVFPLITAFVCMAQKFFGYFKYLSPHSYKVKKQDREEVAEEEQEVYLPRVLHPEAPARTMIQQTDEAADCSLNIRASSVVQN